MKKNTLLTCILFISMYLAYFIHLQFIPTQKEFLVRSYFMNILIAMISLILLGIGIQKRKYNLTSLYLLTVVLKVFVYFIYFDPKFRLDGVVTKEEFLIFFIPYLLCLSAEIFLLSRRFS